MNPIGLFVFVLSFAGIRQTPLQELLKKPADCKQPSQEPVQQASQEPSQDRHFVRPDKRLYVVADGHGPDGGIIAQMLVDLIGRLDLPFNKDEFQQCIWDVLKSNWATFPTNGGSTLLVVLFNEDMTKALSFHLGDSYAIFNLPKDFKGDARKHVSGASKDSPWTQQGQPLDIRSKHGMSVKGLDCRFMQDGTMKTNIGNFTTIGVQPGVFTTDFQLNFLKDHVAHTYEVELLEDRMHVFGSDGMPIDNPAFWTALRESKMEEWMRETYPKDRDDFTCICVEEEDLSERQI